MHLSIILKLRSISSEIHSSIQSKKELRTVDYQTPISEKKRKERKQRKKKGKRKRERMKGGRKEEIKKQKERKTKKGGKEKKGKV